MAIEVVNPKRIARGGVVLALRQETIEKFGNDPDELSHGSGKRCLVRCDYCGDIFDRKYTDITKGRKNIQKDACRKNECKQKKHKEVCTQKYGVEHYSQTVEFNVKQEQTYLKKYGLKSWPRSEEDLQNSSRAMKDPEVQARKAQTCLERYGAEHPLKCSEFKEKLRQTNLEKYGVDNPSKVPEFQEKSKQTCVEKYGVPYVFQDEGVKRKIVQTNLKNLGVEHPSQSASVRQKTDQTMMDKYGVKSIFQTEESKRKAHAAQADPAVKEKRKQTTLEKYGVDHPSKSPEIIAKRKQTNLQRYGVESPIQAEHMREMYSELYKMPFEEVERRCAKKGYLPLFSEKEYHNDRQVLSFKCLKHDIEFQSHLSCIARERFNQCPKCKVTRTSREELEICEFVSQYSGNIVKNDRKVIYPLEIDVFLPEVAVGIEHNGLYWHSEKAKSADCHVDKFEKCREKGVLLLQFFEDEWRDKKEICKSIIKEKIGAAQNRISEQQCEVGFCGKKEKNIKKFLNDNHILGHKEFDTGAFLEDESGRIVFAVTLKERDQTLEIVRVCSVVGLVIEGAFARVLESIIEQSFPYPIIASSDCRFGYGDVYRDNGFEFVRHASPDYRRIDVASRTRKSRFGFRCGGKKEDGLKIYDAGNYIWELKL